MSKELTSDRRSYIAWTTISAWSLALNLLLTTTLVLVDGWLGLFLTGPMMILAFITGCSGVVISRDSYESGRTQGAILGGVVNALLALWPALALLRWVLSL